MNTTTATAPQNTVYASTQEAVKKIFKNTATLQSIANHYAYRNHIKTASPLHDNVFSLAVEKTLRAINSNSVILSKNDIMAYYKTACHTSAIDVVRTEKSQKRDIGLTNSYNVMLGDGEGTEMVSLLPNNNSPLPDSLINHSDMVNIIDSEMTRLLSDTENFLIRVFYFEQKKLEEIASENGMPLGTVKGSLYRAKGKLKASSLLASVFK